MLFGIDPALKRAAMRKAHTHGLSYAAVLNLATRAYVDGALDISAFDTRLARSVDDARAGRTFTLGEVKKRLRVR